MEKNLYRARVLWRSMTRILSREGVAPRVYILFLKVVVQEVQAVQAVLLFGLDTWA